ncbi:MAG: CpsD/CapB family tyrosine-protein kinase, partial [Gemmatimonadaceae bacterium]
VSLAVSSPSPGEGKSLISANLAMSFADAGLRTVLVDGDTRRGTIHEMFGIAVSPGLTDYLASNASIQDISRATAQDKLTVIPCGIRHRANPELLTSPLLVTLVDQLKAEYDVVIFDTPPLAAGIDAYSIAVAAGSLALVLRVGQTERRMAAAKMRMFERLPVDLVGAVLNGIEFQGEYEYYGYVGGYAADEEPGTAIANVP